MTGYDIAFPFIFIIWLCFIVGGGLYIATREPCSKAKRKHK